MTQDLVAFSLTLRSGRVLMRRARAAAGILVYRRSGEERGGG